MPNSSHRRRRRRYRRSPLSDLLSVLLAVLLIAALVVALRGCADKPGDAQTDPPVSDPAATDPLDPSSSSPPPETSAPPSQAVKESEVPWYLTLVNASHPLPEGYEVETSTLSNGLTYDSRAYDALMEMLDACRAAGLEPLVCSAYRSVSRQTELFNNKLNQYLADGLSHDEAYAATAAEIAIPGTSEHNLGLAADICALSYQLLDESQENTPEQQWLMAHCQEYGFILRYPEDKSELTGIIYEPWHYRYVGKEAAAEIMEQGLCLEEYLDLYYDID